MSDPEPEKASHFKSARLKVERAVSHANEYRAVLDAFVKSNPIRISAEIDPKTGQPIIKGVFEKPIPDGLFLSAADAIQNLRSALDQAASCCARAAGYSSRNTYFPHGKDEAGFMDYLGVKNCEKIPEVVREAIADLQPYYGGKGYLIRALHDLNIVDKHNKLLDVGYAVAKVQVSNNVRSSGGTTWRYSEGKLETLEPNPTSQVNERIQVTIRTTFLDVKAVKGEAVMHVLSEMTKVVSRAIEVMETGLATFIAIEK
jgi:hypothetical protein